MDPPPNTRYNRITNLNVLVNCVLYNPAAAVQIFESHSATRKFFENWFKAITTVGGMPRVHAKKLTILAICALLETDPAALPPTIQDGWSPIMAGVLKTLREMPAALEGMVWRASL